MGAECDLRDLQTFFSGISFKAHCALFNHNSKILQSKSSVYQFYVPV